MSQSKIEWTELTLNVTTGCDKISAGCKYCYAEVMANRLQAMNTPGYDNGFTLSLMPERLEQPLKRKKPTTFFVNSMSDLFHNAIPDAYLDQVFDVIRQTPQHRYQVLTKRAERLTDYFGKNPIPENVWLGVTVENIKDGLPRIECLRQVPAKVRFLSIEPLLEDLGEIDLAGIHWVIVGGESGAKARKMEPSWVESIKYQCEAKGVAFFFKQWGKWGEDGEPRTKKANGGLLGGVIYNAMPVQFY